MSHWLAPQLEDGRVSPCAADTAWMQTFCSRLGMKRGRGDVFPEEKVTGLVLGFLGDPGGKMKRYRCFVSVSAFFFCVLFHLFYFIFFFNF